MSKAVELKTILQKENVVLLDVRSAGEVAAQSLQSSMDVLNIPVGSVGAEAKDKIPDQDGTQGIHFYHWDHISLEIHLTPTFCIFVFVKLMWSFSAGVG